MSSALRIAHGSFGRVALLDMDRSLVRHAHPHCHVLIKAEGADTHFSVGDDLIDLTDTQVVLVNAWQPHAYVHDPRRPRTIILALYIEPEWLKLMRSNWASSGLGGFFEQPAGEASPRIRNLASDLSTIMVADPDAKPVHEQLLADLMIAVIERFTSWRTHPVSLRSAATANRLDARIYRAVEIVRREPHLTSDVNALAKQAGMSRANFYRLFESHAGMSPRMYINMVRLEMAVDAVVNSRDSLCRVSDRLGFSAPSHFTRFFRDHAGVRPSEFRSVAQIGQMDRIPVPSRNLA